MEEQRLDLISSLPFDILQRIIAFLPLKDAVRTSTLSTVWRNLWAPNQVKMDFNADQITNHKATEEIKEAIGKFLKSDDSHEIWKFFLGFTESKKLSLGTKDELIVLATKGVQKELHLEFSQNEKVTSNFHLRLEPNSVGFCNNPCTQMASFSSLKTLHLRSVNPLAKNLVSALSSNCQLLESLKLEKCTGLRSLDVEANNCLKGLIVVDCPSMINVTVSAPNLKSFWYQGVLPQIQLKNTVNLDDVRLDLRDGPGLNEIDCEEVLSLLASFKEVETLTISGWLLEWLCSAGVIFPQLEFQFNKLKEVYWIDSIFNKHKRDSLACFLNICPLLERLLIKIDCSLSPVPCPFYHQYWHEPHLWMDYATVKSNASQLEHLKIVRFLGFTYEEEQLLLMDLLLKKAVMLKSIIVTSPEDCSWWVAKMPQIELKQTSRSPPNHIIVLSPTKDYFFKFTEENSSGLCPQNGWTL